MTRLAFIFAVLAAPLAAQDMAFDPAITGQCLADTTTDAACIGAAANQCMTDTLGGSSTVGMGGCLHPEYEYWDARLNRSYQKVLAQSKAMDTELEASGVFMLDIADNLVRMQRSWITFRDAACDYERTL